MAKVTVKWKNLDKAFGELEAEITEVAKGIINETWNFILAQTPQYYGGLTASWTYTFNPGYFANREALIRPVDRAEDSMWRTDNYKIRRKGHPDAIRIANENTSSSMDTHFKLGVPAYFTNGANHGEGAYASLIETVSVRLRPVNMPGRMATRAVDRVESRYGRGVTKQQAARLKNVKRGGGAADNP